MREYKFRAWDNHDQCWLNSFAIFYNGEFADMAKGVMHGDICQCDINYQKTPSHIIIEQFTGLHDKNGVEIYEGDVVKLIDSNNKILECTVEYITGSFWYVIQHNQLTIGVWEYHNFINKSVEVIGNIHEEVVE